MLTLLKQTQRTAVCFSPSCRLSSRASSGPSPLGDEVMVGSSRELLHALCSQVEVRTAFITEEEEAALLRELEPGLKKKRYEFDHWDDVRHIHGSDQIISVQNVTN